MEEPSREAAIRALDLALSQEPDNVDLLWRRAGLLAARGRTREAQADYLAVVKLNPDHFGALNDLGALLHQTDFRTAARTVYAEVARRHPKNPIGRINLANALLAAEDHAGARFEFEAALEIDPDHPDAHQGLANLLQDQGDAARAEIHRQASYRRRGPSHAPFTGEGRPCRVLQLVSAAGGNTPTRFLLDPAVFSVVTIVVEAHHPQADLPDHDVVFNAIGDADLCAIALRQAQTLVAGTRKGIVNPPGAVLATGRADNARRLGGGAVRTPLMRLAPRRDLAAAAEEFGFPLLLRALGYHTGRHFVRVEIPQDLAAAAGSMPGDDLLLIEPLTPLAPPHRKYRVMAVGGRLFPLHLAIGEDWKVHYFTADMAVRSDYRAAEADFLTDMGRTLGPRAMQGLADIAKGLGLDYAGIDFGLDQDGAVLLFEANAAMVVFPPPSDPVWDYRRGAVNAVLDAVKALVRARADKDAVPQREPLL